jgi:hypothetical protein
VTRDTEGFWSIRGRAELWRRDGCGPTVFPRLRLDINPERERVGRIGRALDDPARERQLDETIEESFPASDPPANTVESGVRIGGTAFVGAGCRQPRGPTA